MALEISEIGISMRVRAGSDEPTSAAPRGERGGCNDQDREEIVADCVSRVLQFLRTREER